MKIVLASGNMHKKAELSHIFRGHSLLLASDLGIRFHHEETGSTYLENALGKALTLNRLMRETGEPPVPVLADDSGISLPVLGGEPGIYSARYGSREKGRELSDTERNLFLLEKMSGTEDRRAFFVCSMVLLVDEYRFFTAQEILPGILARKPAGTGGFGYDPLLFLPEKGCTVAQLSAEEKNRISHRARAAAAIKTLIENNLERNRR